VRSTTHYSKVILRIAEPTWPVADASAWNLVLATRPDTPGAGLQRHAGAG
jgi:hypothetical protein